MNTMTELFGEPISVYTRKQAIEDGFLVDLTEWASSKTGFIGGFDCSVCVTNTLWADIERKPAIQDVRGRAHDLLWMASLAARAMIKRQMTVGLFDVIMQVGRTKKQRYKIVLGHDDDGAPAVTLMKRDED